MEISKLINLGEIIVGTNEEFLLGYTVAVNEDESLTLKPSFTNHSHNGRIKQVATNGIFLASGSSDESIRIFNLRNRMEVGCILPHNATVTCLHFHDSGFLFSGSEDGKIVILKKKSWEVEKELKGHKREITSIAVHPSGKLGLSVAKDSTMITWDLMKGKKAHLVRLKKAGDFIAWSPNASQYLIASKNLLDIYSVESGKVVDSVDFKAHIYCCCFVTNELFVIGGEKKQLCLYDAKEEMGEWEAHQNRTKSLVSIESHDEEARLIASSSSDGLIKVWRIDLSCVRRTPTLLGQLDTKCRIICMAFSCWPASQLRSHLEEESSKLPKKRKYKRYKIGLKKTKTLDAAEESSSERTTLESC